MAEAPESGRPLFLNLAHAQWAKRHTESQNRDDLVLVGIGILLESQASLHGKVNKLMDQNAQLSSLVGQMGTTVQHFGDTLDGIDSDVTTVLDELKADQSGSTAVANAITALTTIQTNAQKSSDHADKVKSALDAAQPIPTPPVVAPPVVIAPADPKPNPADPAEPATPVDPASPATGS